MKKGRFSAVTESLKKGKTVHPDKEVELDKEDYKALTRAAYSVFFPALLAVIAFFALVILIITWIW